MPVRLLHLLAMIFSALPVVLSAVACVIFHVLPVVLVFLVAVAGVISPVLSVVLVFLVAVACVNFSPRPVVLLLLPVAVTWLIFSPLPAVFVAVVAWVIFSVLFLSAALHVAAVAWVIFSVLFLPAALQRMDLYLTPMFHLLPQSSVTRNSILRIVFCPMPCPSATLPVKRVVQVRSILHLENTVCVSSSKHPPSCARTNNQHTHHRNMNFPSELDNAVFHKSS